MDPKAILAILNLPRLIPHIILYSITSTKSIIQEDIVSNYRGKSHGLWLNLLILLVFKRQFRNIFYHRMGRKSLLLKWLLPEDPTFILDKQMFIGSGMCSGHSFSTIVNANSIGRNFTVFQNVTVGVSNGAKPTIGNNVSMYTHSVAIGDIKIGNNVIIGACCLITKDVPDNAVVVGNPARIVRLNNDKVNIKL